MISPVFGQFSDNFSDGDFSANPTWTGTLFTVLSNQLRSNSPGAATYSLSTPSSQATQTQWEFLINLKFATSGTNYVKVFLTSDNADVNVTQNGYFVEIGNTTDEISLYKIVGGATSILINGADGLLNSSTNNLYRIKVVRDAADLWTLSYDKDTLGTFVSEGSITDNSLSTSTYFGIGIVQSSAASVVNNHFFDDFYVGNIILDTIAPTVDSVMVIGATQLDVLFNEPLDSVSAQTEANYSVNQSIGIPSNAVLDGGNTALVHLTFASSFSNMQNYVLSTQNVSDVSMNPSTLEQNSFTYLVAAVPLAGDVLINEFMADPSPSVGLPETEYVEIFNTTSTKVFHLKNWKLSDNSTTGTLGDKWLLPGQYLILAPTGADTLYSNVCIVSSFASLNNTDDQIILKDTGNLVLDQLSYTDDWYHDANKDDGGYSIERINPFAPCSGSNNWAASQSPNGGTPNSQNSIYSTAADTVAPSLLDAFPDSLHWLTLQFSETIDSALLMTLPLQISPNVTIVTRLAEGPYATQLLVEVLEGFEVGVEYTVLLQNLSDCWGNTSTLSRDFVYPSSPTEGELIINEILSNPLTGGTDYVELYNNSDKTFDLKNCFLATMSDSISNLESVTLNHYLLQPDQYVLISEDSTQVKQSYPHYGWGTFLQSDLPSYADDEGKVYFLSAVKTVIDHVDYDEKWQFSLLESTDGVSLERINPSGPSNDASNWQSASENVQFGTPGLRNSQYLASKIDSKIVVQPSTFSPDDDGYEDFTLFNYTLPEPGMTGSILIFDEMGRQVRQLVNNYYFDTQGFVKWDGLKDDQSKAGVGRYIVFFNIRSTADETYIKEKKIVTIASKMAGK